jgi:hypothetical protein
MGELPLEETLGTLQDGGDFGPRFRLSPGQDSVQVEGHREREAEKCRQSKSKFDEVGGCRGSLPDVIMQALVRGLVLSGLLT